MSLWEACTVHRKKKKSSWLWVCLQPTPTVHTSLLSYLLSSWTLKTFVPIYNLKTSFLVVLSFCPESKYSQLVLRVQIQIDANIYMLYMLIFLCTISVQQIYREVLWKSCIFVLDSWNYVVLGGILYGFKTFPQDSYIIKVLVCL